MYIVAGLVDVAAPPHFRGSFQLTCDKYLKKKKGGDHHYTTSEHFQTFKITQVIIGSLCSLNPGERGKHRAAAEVSKPSFWAGKECSILLLLHQ